MSLSNPRIPFDKAGWRSQAPQFVPCLGHTGEPGEAAGVPGWTQALKPQGPGRAQHWCDGAAPHHPEADARSYQKGHFGASNVISGARFSPEIEN